MNYVTLNNGVKMPVMGIGTYLLVPDDAENAVEIALKNGYELIDTANAYVNEKAVGRGMKKVRSFKGQNFFLRQSFGHPFMKMKQQLMKH